MTNQITMGKHEAITSLYAAGFKKREIARRLEVDIKTVRTHLALSAANSPISPPGSTDSNSTISPGGKLGDIERARPGRPSSCEDFREKIEAAIKNGLSVRRIYQDLRTETSFAASYDAVKRFARRLVPADARVWRMETRAGEEAQVDFGRGARIRLADGKSRWSWVFRIVLSYSRKAYSEAVLHQSTESFIRCIENAFRFFGGVPATIILDNLRAAVKRADWWDPELVPKIVEFGRHYGTVFMPTRARHAEHKGKVENSVKYVKSNALKGREFQGLDEENQFLGHWEQTVADLRIHGTTRRQVAGLFAEEKPFLKPLPATLFPCFQEGKRRVHRDSFVEVAKAYYQVPPEFIGRDVWVRWDSHLVRVFDGKFQQVAVLARQKPGQFSESLGAQGLSHPVEQSAKYWLDRAMKLGEHCGLWASRVFDQRGAWGIRVFQGLVALSRQYPAQAINEACRQALTLHRYRLRDIKTLVRYPAEQLQMDFLSVHPLIRNMSEYADVLNRMNASN